MQDCNFSLHCHLCTFIIKETFENIIHYSSKISKVFPIRGSLVFIAIVRIFILFMFLAPPATDRTHSCYRIFFINFYIDNKSLGRHLLLQVLIKSIAFLHLLVLLHYSKQLLYYKK